MARTEFYESRGDKRNSTESLLRFSRREEPGELLQSQSRATFLLAVRPVGAYGNPQLR